MRVFFLLSIVCENNKELIANQSDSHAFQVVLVPNH